MLQQIFHRASCDLLRRLLLTNLVLPVILSLLWSGTQLKQVGLAGAPQFDYALLRCIEGLLGVLHRVEGFSLAG